MVKVNRKPTKPAKKFKTKVGKPKAIKLEERIAPGMIGGGVVDQGMADLTEDASPSRDQLSDGARATTGSSIDSADSSGSSEAGNRLTDTTDTHFNSRDGEGEVEDGDNTPEANYSGLDANVADGAQVSAGIPSWQQPEWVNVAADGSVEVNLPEGATVEDGVANFPADQAAAALPEGVSFSTTSGVAFIALPPEASMDAEAGTLTLPSESPLAEAVPEALDSHTNPDGSLTVSLPSEGVSYDAENNTLSVDNAVVNQLLPENMTVGLDGSVSVELPENVDVTDEGALSLTADQAAELSDPLPEVLAGSDLVDVNPDGSVVMSVPEEVSISQTDGTAEIPLETVNDVLPLPENIEITPEGTIDVTMPEGTLYDANSGTVTFPQDPASGVTYENVPEGFEAHVNPDNTVSVRLPEGVTYDAATNTVEMDNYWANEVMPDNVAITSGAAFLALPPFHFNLDESTVTISPEQVEALVDPVPEVFQGAPEYVSSTPQGAIEIAPAADSSVVVNPEEGVVAMPVATLQEDFGHLLPEGVALTQEGTMEAVLPQGTQYEAASETLTVPPGTIHPNEIPGSVEAVVNEDGSLSVTLPEGISYDADSNTVSLDNYWTNEVMPSNVEISTEGVVTVDLPQSTEYTAEGTAVIPPESADFIDNPEPAFVTEGPDYVVANSDGSVAVTLPEGVTVNEEEGTVSLPAETVNQDFGNLLPVEATFTSEGTLEVTLPEGSVFNETDNALTLPADTLSIHEIPEGIPAVLNDDGSLNIKVPDGVSVDQGAGTITLDQYWTNEVLPENVSVSPTGEVTVSLPSDTQYFGETGFTISSDSTDFLENPEPAFATEGPDWVQANPDGSVSIAPPENATLDAEASTLTLPVETVTSEFSAVIPDGVALNGDGSVTLEVPQSVQYDAVNETLTFPKGEIHVNEIPAVADPVLNSDGSVTVTLPEGATYDSASQTVRVDNQIADEVLPPAVSLSAEGEVTVTLPPDVHVLELAATSDVGSATVVTVPAGEANLLASPAETSVAESNDSDEIPMSAKDLQRWEKIEASVDKWLDKFEDQIQRGKALPSNLDERWEKLESNAEKWLDNNSAKAGFTAASSDWAELDSRADRLMEKWESALESRLADRFDSFDKNADKLLDSWEKQVDRWEHRADRGNYGDQFDDRIGKRLEEMEKRWDRMDTKVDKWIDKWSSKHELTENKGEWKEANQRAEDLFEKIRALKQRVS